MTTKPNIKVVLSGSGVKYFCHIGALQALEKYYNITHICGTSGGAIVAALYASGFGFDHRPGFRGSLEDLSLQLLPKKYINYSWNPLAKPYGLVKTNAFKDIFNALLIHQFNSTFVDLSIVTVNLEDGEHVIWNRNNPIHIPDAVVASMSIPLVFEYSRLHGKIHVDGGVAANFPVDIYGTGEDVIGVKIKSTNKKNNLNGISNFISSVVDTMIMSVEREHMSDAMYARIIDIPIDYPTTGFNVTISDAKRMIKVGYEYTVRLLENQSLRVHP